MPIVTIYGMPITASMATVIVAVASVIVSAISCHLRCRHFRRDNALTSLLNGGTIVPFAAIALSPFSAGVKEAAMASSEGIVLAGLVGLLHVGGEVIFPNNENKPNTIA